MLRRAPHTAHTGQARTYLPHTGQTWTHLPLTTQATIIGRVRTQVTDLGVPLGVTDSEFTHLIAHAYNDSYNSESRIPLTHLPAGSLVMNRAGTVWTHHGDGFYRQPGSDTDLTGYDIVNRLGGNVGLLYIPLVHVERAARALAGQLGDEWVGLDREARQRYMLAARATVAAAHEALEWSAMEVRYLPDSVVLQCGTSGELFHRRPADPAHMYPVAGGERVHVGAFVFDRKFRLLTHPTWTTPYQKGVG